MTTATRNAKTATQAYSPDPGTALFNLVSEYVRTHPGIAHDLARWIVLHDPANAEQVKRYGGIPPEWEKRP